MVRPTSFHAQKQVHVGEHCQRAESGWGCSGRRRQRQQRQRGDGTRRVRHESCFADPPAACEGEVAVGTDLLALITKPHPEVSADAGVSTSIFTYNGELPVENTLSCVSAGSPSDLLKNQERCKEVMEQLDDADEVSRLRALLWFHKDIGRLAQDKHGTRIVQKAIEVFNGPDLDLIIAELKDVLDLSRCPHGNFVLSKAIEALPTSKIEFIVQALTGHFMPVAKHRFGCRVICRLIEHCSANQIGDLWEEIVAESDSLARHPWGNFVLQHALEHGEAYRSRIVEVLLPNFSTLPNDRVGSLVAQKVFDFVSTNDKALVLNAMLQAQGSNSIIETARHKFGSYVIEQLADLRQSHSEAEEIAKILARHSQTPSAPNIPKRVLDAFKLDSAANSALSVES